jgi:hypothetical protein
MPLTWACCAAAVQQRAFMHLLVRSFCGAVVVPMVVSVAAVQPRQLRLWLGATEAPTKRRSTSDGASSSSALLAAHGGASGSAFMPAAPPGDGSQ